MKICLKIVSNYPRRINVSRCEIFPFASTIEILFDHDVEFEIYNMYMRIFVERGIQISTGGKFD